MSGRGKGGKGLGKGRTKWHLKVLCDNIKNIPKQVMCCLVCSGRVKDISDLVCEETRWVLKVFLENVIRGVVSYTEHAKHQTVTAMDVLSALKCQGHTFYGFGGLANQSFLPNTKAL
ncbi:histone H4-like [Heterodontus francisci]|uniref:histone H4-like n=1 Tax=Heterodontus francisci TaxID=7792 RepID=UPI00355AE247